LGLPGGGSREDAAVLPSGRDLPIDDALEGIHDTNVDVASDHRRLASSSDHGPR